MSLDPFNHREFTFYSNSKRSMVNGGKSSNESKKDGEIPSSVKMVALNLERDHTPKFVTNSMQMPKKASTPEGVSAIGEDGFRPELLDIKATRSQKKNSF
jgi:hypothetical protein